MYQIGIICTLEPDGLKVALLSNCAEANVTEKVYVGLLMKLIKDNMAKLGEDTVKKLGYKGNVEICEITKEVRRG